MMPHLVLSMSALTFAEDHGAVDDVDDLDLEIGAAGDDGPVVGAEPDGLHLPAVRSHLLDHLYRDGKFKPSITINSVSMSIYFSLAGRLLLWLPSAQAE